jgi:hypothetical protein
MVSQIMLSLMLRNLMIPLVALLMLLDLKIIIEVSQIFTSPTSRSCNDLIPRLLIWNGNESTIVLPRFLGINNTMLDSNDRGIHEQQRRDSASAAGFGSDSDADSAWTDASKVR